MSFRLLDEDDEIDPILSVVNLVDVFLVLVAGLMMVIAANPLNPFADEDLLIIKNPGQESMEMIFKQGDEVKRFAATGSQGEGDGVRAGVAYRLQDGSIVYVPEAAETQAEAPES
jgi:hypothetical protein